MFVVLLGICDDYRTAQTGMEKHNYAKLDSAKLYILVGRVGAR